MQLLKVLVLCCSAAATQGCLNCSKTTDRAVSPDGRYVAWVEVGDGCGGATVGYITDVMIVRRSWLFVTRANVLVVKSDVKAKLRWKDAHHLEVTIHPWDLNYNEVRHFVPRWKDVTVSYVVKLTPLNELVPPQ